MLECFGKGFQAFMKVSNEKCNQKTGNGRWHAVAGASRSEVSGLIVKPIAKEKLKAL
jgi:hypothetical protein